MSTDPIECSKNEIISITATSGRIKLKEKSSKGVSLLYDRIILKQTCEISKYLTFKLSIPLASC